MKIFNLIALSLFATSAYASEQGLRRMAADLDIQDEPQSSSTTTTTTITRTTTSMVQISIYNAAFQQPFSPFFVMTHNANVQLFKIGNSSSSALAALAENGDPSLLVEQYTNADGVGFVALVNEGAPYFGGETVSFEVPFDQDYPYISMASMAINTNDCFVALNGVKLELKGSHESPGYDSGSEENNELCSSIPGPACADTDKGNEASGNGEGVVHIHRGFFGVGRVLSQAGYDWKNPMMTVDMQF